MKKHLNVLLTALCICQSMHLCAEQVPETIQSRAVKGKAVVQQGIQELKSSLQDTGAKIVKSIEKGKGKVMNLVTKNKATSEFTPEDFKFEEFKNIDISKCKRLDVKEIKTNFEKPVWFVKTEGSTVSVCIKFRNEGTRSFKDKPCLLQILKECIKDNVGTHGTGGFRKVLKDHAIDLDFNVDHDNVTVSFSCLAKYYDLALSFVCELMTQSLLPENNIEKAKAEEIDNLNKDKVTPHVVASEKMSQIVCIKEYAWSFDECLKLIPTYTRDDVVKCYKTLFDPRNAEVTIVGNVSEEQVVSGMNNVRETIKDRRNDFKAGEQRTELMTSQAQIKRYEIDNENASVLCMLPGVAKTDADKYAIRVANRIWSNNGVSSRLFVDIREKQHLVYAIWSTFQNLDLQCGLRISAKTSPQYIDAVISGIVKNCKNLADKGITEEEFLSDRIRIVASRVLHSPSAIMSYVLARRADGATVATVDEHLDKYAKLTVADVNKVLKKVFDVNKMVVVSVGKTVPQVDKAQAHVEINNMPPAKTELNKNKQSNIEASQDNKQEITQVNKKESTSIDSSTKLTTFPIDEAYLENGLRIVVCNMPCSKDAVFFNVGYYVGAADDPRNIVGASHFLEHMAFKESKNIPAGKMDHYLSTFNNYTNAFTCEDITFYTQHCNKAFLDADLRLESERMSNAKFLEQTVKGETNVILAEREMGTESDPYVKYIEEALLKDIYLYSNYSNGVIGYRDQIKNCTAENLSKHYEKFYKPNNAIAIFVGDITIGEAKDLCQKNFGRIKKGEDIKRQRVIDPEDVDISRVLTHRNPQIKQKRLGLVYKIPRKDISTLKQKVILEMVNDMLFGSDSSVIRDKICDRLELAHNVRSCMEIRAYDFAFLNIEFDVNSIETQFSEIESKVDKTLNDFIKQKFPNDIQGRFEKLKRSFKNRYEQLLDDPDAMNWYLIFGLMVERNSITEMREVISIIDTITFDEFMTTAKKLLEPKHKIVVVHYEPSDAN